MYNIEGNVINTGNLKIKYYNWRKKGSVCGGGEEESRRTGKCTTFSFLIAEKQSVNMEHSSKPCMAPTCQCFSQRCSDQMLVCPTSSEGLLKIQIVWPTYRVSGAGVGWHLRTCMSNKSLGDCWSHWSTDVSKGPLT